MFGNIFLVLYVLIAYLHLSVNPDVDENIEIADGEIILSGVNVSFK